MLRDAIKGVNGIDTDSAIISSSPASSGRLHLVQRVIVAIARRVFIVSFRGQYRRLRVFGQRLAWGNGRNTAADTYPSAKPVSNAVSERRHCRGNRAFFMFAFLEE